MMMRFSLITLSAILISACATVQNSSYTSASSGLPTSKLAPGECGLFGWATDETRKFVFYADKDTARYDSPEGPVDLTAQMAFPATDYIDSSGKAVTLRLGEGEIMDGGMRYPGARIVTLTDEGWERLHPIAIVRSCQP